MFRTKYVVPIMSALVAATGANAQSPAMHVGTFAIGAPAHCGGHNWCNSIVGPSAMRDEGLRVTRSGGLSFGVASNVSVVVVCTPSGNRSAVAVVAASSNSGIAERFRNNVRSRMVRSRCL
jgi:hypothetical protein